jgi:adenine-specific DNA-methyltransferase
VTKEQLKIKLKELIVKFKEEKGWERSEEHIQTYFTIKILDFLGWDSSSVRVNEGQEVKTGKLPDILLHNEGNTLLVIESKDAPHKDKLDGRYLKKTFVQQLNEYCNAEGIFWGILTNFIEWRMYSIYQNRLYKDRKYAFHELLWPEANSKDYIDLLSDEGLNFLEHLSKKEMIDVKGRWDRDPVYYDIQQKIEELKDEFFSKIKSWRLKLHNFLKEKYSKEIKEDSIDIMAQKIIDRIIFLDICFDKGVISQNHLKAVFQTKINKYEELKRIFKILDDQFNSELFIACEIDDISIDDEILNTIIKELELIDFKDIDVHVIGEVYENYLAELQKRSTEDKEKKKKQSQGIYYTPDYVVNYIVKNTVGKILSNLSKEADFEKIKVLDPACGSGSFLIRVFDEFLLNYRRINKKVGRLFEFDIKKKILQNNIFGIDIDPKAVEITKLNLMIKALEDIKPEDLKGKHLLPNLNLNIRVGDSLRGLNISQFDKDSQAKLKEIAHDKETFYLERDYDKQKKLLNEIKENEYFVYNRIKNLDNEVVPFNYRIAYPEIFASGGFDCVLGNPPYIKEDANKAAFNNLHEDPYYEGKMDIWTMFTCKSIDLLKNDGLHSFIALNNWGTSAGASIMRNKVIKDTEIISFLDFNVFNPFQGRAGIQTMIYVLKKSTEKKSFTINYAKVKNSKIEMKKLNNFLKNNLADDSIQTFKTRFIRDQLLDTTITFTNTDTDAITDKILKTAKYRIKDADIGNGIDVLQDFVSKKHISKLKDSNIKPGDGIFVLSNSELKKLNFNKHELAAIKPYYTSKQLTHYIGSKKNEDWIIYSNEEVRNKINDYPNIKKHLDKFQKVMTSVFKPYGLHRAREQHYFEGNKIFSLRKTAGASFSYTDFPCYVSRAFLIIQTSAIDMKYLTAVLNSPITNYWLYHKGKKQGEQLQVDKGPLLDVPIYKPTSEADLKIQKNIINFMNALIQKKSNSTSEETLDQKNIIKEINLLIYKLYGLTEEEIKTVEESTK